MNGKKIIIICSIIGLIFVFFMYSKIDRNELITIFSNIDLRILALYIFVVFLEDLLFVIRWNIILKSNNIHIPLYRLFFYNLSGFAGGFLLSQSYLGGEPFRIMLLQKHDVPLKTAVSTQIIDRTVQMTTDLIFNITIIIIILIHFSVSANLKVIFGLAIILPVALISLYYYSMIKRKPFFSAVFMHTKHLQNFARKIKDVEKIVQDFFSQHSNTLPWVYSINLVLLALLLVEYRLLLSLFGIPGMIISILITILGMGFSYSIPVPMALGTLEVSEVALLALVNVGRATAVALSLFVRLKDIIRSTIGLVSLLFFGVGWRQIRGKFFKIRVFL